MTTANSIEIYLKKNQVSYEIIPHPPATTIEEVATAANIDLSQLVRAVMLNGDKGVMMLVIPGDHLVDFSELQYRFGCAFELVPLDEIADLFTESGAEIIPPMAAHYGLRAAVDRKISGMHEVYFQAEAPEYLLRVSGDDFRKLYADAQWGDFSQPVSFLARDGGNEFLLPERAGGDHAISDLLPPEDLKKRVERVRQMPAMPEMASRLLLLKNNPNSSADDLAAVVALDPSLSAQVIRYARSAFFGYRGKVDTIKEAIARVLGFNMVMNMAMGLALGKGFSLPPKGPLGLHEFWRHAVFSATLCQALCAIIPSSIRPKSDLAYLAGLLHNFGYLLMGQVLKPEFFLLNKTVEANPDIPVTLIEKRLLGISHTQIGTWLMNAWNMPEEVIITVGEHHNECYQGNHANYVQLVFLVNCLLKARGLGDAAESEVPLSVINTLGLDPDKVDALVRHILTEREELDTIVRQLIA